MAPAMVPTLRVAQKHAKDAEEAAYKAQDIAMKAAMAFGDVAQKLGRARDSLEGRYLRFRRSTHAARSTLGAPSKAVRDKLRLWRGSE